MKWKLTKKLVVIGLDGVTWNLIDPWIRKGWLPTLRKVINEGVRAHLLSTIPPLTAPAWAAFATGRTPGRNGIYDFTVPRENINELRIMNSQNIICETFYELLERNEFRCILINLPMSYPPRIKNGILISSPFDSKEVTICAPNKETLVERIPELKYYRLIPNMSFLAGGKLNMYINDIRKLEFIRFSCAKKLFKTEKWDFFFILFSGMGWIQHRIYDKLLLGRIDRDDPAVKAFKDIDSYVNWFIENLPSDANLFIMSDHGFQIYRGIFYINEWLRRQRLLSLRISRTSRKIYIKTEEEFMERLKKRKKVFNIPITLYKVISKFATLFRHIPFHDTLYTLLPVRWETSVELSPLNTKALSISSYSIYINLRSRFSHGVVDKNEYEELRNRIIQKLKTMEDKWEKILTIVCKREELYSDSAIDYASDILIYSNRYFISTSFYPQVFKRQIINYYSLLGIFMAYGPDIKKGTRLEKIKIYDIAPTILHVFGIPLSRDLDGVFLKRIFKEDSKIVKKEVKYESSSERRRIKEKLLKLKKKIGYHNRIACDKPEVG